MQKSKQILSIMTSGVVVVTGGYALMRYSESNQFRRSEKIASNEVRSDQNERSQSANETSHLSINPQKTNDKTKNKTKNKTNSHQLKDASSTSINLSQLDSIESSNDSNSADAVEDQTTLQSLTTLSNLKNDKSLKTSDDSLAQSAKSEKALEKKKSERSIEPKLTQSIVSAKGESLVQPELPEAAVTAKGESLVQPELPEATVTAKGESLVQHELPEATVSARGESLVQPELPEYTQPISAKGESLAQPELPKAIVTDKGESLVQPELPEAIVTEKGESLVQPELPKATVAEKGESLVQPELPKAAVSAKGESSVQPELPEAIVAEKGESLVQPELPKATVAEKDESLVQPELPKAAVSAKGESSVQPELPEYAQPISAKGESLVQPELPEAIVTEKGKSLVQPELPEATVSAKGESLVQRELPEYTQSISAKGESLVQPELPEAAVSAKGESLVQPELPEAIVTEKGESLVQPNLPEYAQPISIKGESLVRPELPEFTLIKTIKTKTETIRPPYVRMSDMKLPEGEKRESFPGVEGKVEKEVEEYTSLDGKVYLTKVLSEKRTDPIVRVVRYGTMKAGDQPGKVGVNDAYEHFPNADFAEMNADVRLTAEEIRALSKEEIYSRAKGQYSNTINEVGKPGFYTVRIAPVADKTIDGLNSGTYLDHNLLSEEMLRLVNEERVRIGRRPLKWSNALYNFAKVRSTELANNGHIRFFNEKNESMPHTRDATGKKWYTILADTKYANDTAGENTAGYAMSRNVYSMFSEKFIAEELFEQWKNSRGHYENMISEEYKYFGFSVQFSKFWRSDKDKIDYFFKGAQGVQLFGGDSFKD